MSEARGTTALQPLSLKDLPAHLDLADASPFHSPLSHKHDCPICLRSFGTTDDPSDSTHPPCQPMRLHGCGHILGSTCLKKLLRTNMHQCPLCRTPIRFNPGSNPVPHWLRWLLSSQQFPFSTVTLWINMARPSIASQGSELDLEVREFDDLHEKLLAGRMNEEERRKVWTLYMQVPFTDTPVAILFVASIVVFTSGMDYILQLDALSSGSSTFDRTPETAKLLRLNRTIPTLILGIIALFIGERCVTIPRRNRILQWPLWLAIAWFSVSAICLARALPIWLLFLVTVSDCLIFGVVVWALLTIGTRNRRFW